MSSNHSVCLLFVDYEALDKKDKDNTAKTTTTKTRQHGPTATPQNKGSDQGTEKGSDSSPKNKKTSPKKKKASPSTTTNKESQSQTQTQTQTQEKPYDEVGSGSDNALQEVQGLASDLLKDLPTTTTTVSNGLSSIAMSASDDDDDSTPNDTNDNNNQPRFSVQ